MNILPTLLEGYGTLCLVPTERRIIYSYVLRTQRPVLSYHTLPTLQTPDAGQIPALARPAAPLATCVQQISSVDKTNKNWRFPRQRPRWDRKANFTLIIHSHSYADPENLTQTGPIDSE